MRPRRKKYHAKYHTKMYKNVQKCKKINSEGEKEKALKR